MVVYVALLTVMRLLPPVNDKAAVLADGQSVYVALLHVAAAAVRKDCRLQALSSTRMAHRCTGAAWALPACPNAMLLGLMACPAGP